MECFIKGWDVPSEAGFQTMPYLTLCALDPFILSGFLLVLAGTYIFA